MNHDEEVEVVRKALELEKRYRRVVIHIIPFKAKNHRL